MEKREEGDIQCTSRRHAAGVDKSTTARLTGCDQVHQHGVQRCTGKREKGEKQSRQTSTSISAGKAENTGGEADERKGEKGKS